MNPSITTAKPAPQQGSDPLRTRTDFWKVTLSGIPDILQLPLDLPRPRRQELSTANHCFTIGTELYDRLLATAGIDRTESLLLSAFGVLLSRYSLQYDFVIGWCRPAKDSNDILPARFTFSDEMRFTEAISMAEERLSSSLDYLPVPFEEVAGELGLAATPNVNPVFQVLFSYATRSESRLPSQAPVDLSLSVFQGKDRLDCVIGYNNRLFAKETAERIAGHYLTVLHAVASDPELRIPEIPVLTEKEYNRLVLDLNAAARADYPRDKCVHHIFEEQAERTPGNIAVEDDHTSLTYSELNRRANRLAYHLIGQGAREGSVITLFIGRSVNILVSLLAISKTGATYLPLDPIYPKARLELILNDAKPVLTITERSLLDRLPDSGARHVFIDDEGLYLQGSPENTGLGNPLRPAYILYTSGSTGKPKGVPILQRSLVNLINSFSTMMKISPSDIYLTVATIAFDIAELDMYLPLFNGARVVIASQETAMDTDLLIRRFETSGATLFQATPVTYKMLLLNNWKGKPDLRVITGGDATTKDQGKKLLSICKEVWNCYGPTETTIYSTGSMITEDDVTGEGIVNIGRHLDNNFMYVLNSARIPVPAGVPGELYIGGDSVSPGYVNLPELTAERFLPDPFSGEPGATMYRSGDLVKYLPDGRLAFLNRIDSQVKIRGFRIELGEIETVLAQYPGILETVVMVRKDESGDNMLAAYFTCEASAATGPQELRTFLKDRLPDYMVPAAFVRMDQFPLTANRKVDKKALPDPASQSSPTAPAEERKGTATEQKIAGIWRSLLKLDNVSLDDDFFRVGGHSLAAVNLIINLEKEFGARLSLATLFDLPTVHLQAEHLDRLAGNGNQKQTLPWKS